MFITGQHLFCLLTLQIYTTGEDIKVYVLPSYRNTTRFYNSFLLL